MNYDASHMHEWLIKMHEYEHSCDLKKHEMSHALSKAFITPFEREDLADLSYKLDEVADNIEEVLQRFYVDEPQIVMPESIVMAQKISSCCKKLENIFEELPNYKKSAKLSGFVVELNDLEEECDKIYLDAYKKIKSNSKDTLEIVSWRKIYDYLERCADACEHVADTIDMIIMKNS